MSAARSCPLPIKIVEGLPIPEVFLPDVFRSAIHYQPQPDDIFIATYPKCGTTWTQHILALIFRQGQPFTSFIEFMMMSPFLEVAGAEAVKNITRPAALKVHLPFHLVPWSEKAKYIYVSRNPKDCCVSFFHHVQTVPYKSFQGTFDEFFECFMSGCVEFGDYFDHLLGWYEHRNDPNVLFVTYEELKENPKEVILKMASFIDDKVYAEPLRKDPEILNTVIKYSSFDHMKESVNKSVDDLFAMSKEDVLSTKLPDSVKKLFASVRENQKEVKQTQNPTNFVRKGIIGDWKNYFSEEQSRRLDEKFAVKTKGTDIPNLWEKYM